MLSFSYHKDINNLDKEAYYAKDWQTVNNTSEDISSLLGLFCKHKWSPIVFYGGGRSAVNFLSCQLIVLDSDSGFPLEEAHNLFKDYWHIIGTTRSHLRFKHGMKIPKYRVILLLEKPVLTVEDFYHNVRGFIDKYNTSISFLFQHRISAFCERNQSAFTLARPNEKRTLAELWQGSDTHGGKPACGFLPFTEIVYTNFQGVKVPVTQAPIKLKEFHAPESRDKLRELKFNYFNKLQVPSDGTMYCIHCEICQENGADKNGDHLSVRYDLTKQEFLFKCNKDDSHGSQLLRQKILVK